MKKLSAKSNTRVSRLLSPPTDETGLDDIAPRGLTVRQLVHHQSRAGLRRKYTMARTVNDNLLSIGNLIRQGWDLIG